MRMGGSVQLVKLSDDVIWEGGGYFVKKMNVDDVMDDGEREGICSL